LSNSCLRASLPALPTNGPEAIGVASCGTRWPTSRFRPPEGRHQCLRCPGARCGTRLRSIWARPRCRNRRYASTAVLATRRASAEDRPAFQEADHLLGSASARSMAAAVQRSDRQVDHALACWEDHVRGERLDRGVASLDFQGSRTWAPIFSSNLRCRRPRSRRRR
jgi:hypothetical protein